MAGRAFTEAASAGANLPGVLAAAAGGKASREEIAFPWQRYQ